MECQPKTTTSPLFIECARSEGVTTLLLKAIWPRQLLQMVSFIKVKALLRICRFSFPEIATNVDE